MRRLEVAPSIGLILLVASAGLAGCAAPAHTAAIAPYPAPVAIESQPLIGSTPTILSAEFGQPVLLRVEGTAQIWLYHSGSCGLNLILYPDATGIPRVINASTTGDGAIGGGTTTDDCTASLQQAHFDTATIPPPAIAALEHPASS